jgi:threonine/homoserine/homoserine lactone efflux protein
MTGQTWLALVVFATVACFTPGPGNMLMMTSGLRRGVVATLPLLVSINLGFLALFGAVGAGLGALIATFPWAALALKLTGGCYTLWLALKLARAGPPRTGGDDALPGVVGGFLLQWANGKAWLIAVAAIAAYGNPERTIESLGIVTMTFFVIGVAGNLVWAVGGAMLGARIVADAAARRTNTLLALLLALSALPIFLS